MGTTKRSVTTPFSPAITDSILLRHRYTHAVPLHTPPPAREKTAAAWRRRAPPRGTLPCMRAAFYFTHRVLALVLPLLPALAAPLSTADGRTNPFLPPANITTNKHCYSFTCNLQPPFSGTGLNRCPTCLLFPTHFVTGTFCDRTCAEQTCNTLPF